MDPNVAKIIEKTRNRTAGAKKSRFAEGTPAKTSPSKRIPIEVEQRSPLKPRNFDEKISRVQSPRKGVEVSESPSDTIKRILSRESLETSVSELLSRDSPGKSMNTRVYSSTSTSPSKTRITKTVVTEKEEKFEKREVITYKGNKEFIKDVESGKIKDHLEIIEKMTTSSQDSPASNDALKNFLPKEVKSPVAPVLPENDDYFAARKARLANLANKFKNMEDDPRHFDIGSRNAEESVGAPSAASHSPVRTDYIRSRSPIKTNPMQYVSPVKASPVVPQPVGSRSTSPSKISTNVTAKPYTASPTRPRGISPVKPPVPSPVKPSPTKSAQPSPAPTVSRPDESLISSLKAQGFSESESASKLIYEFEKRDRSVSPCKPAVKKSKENSEQIERGRPLTRSPVKERHVEERGRPLNRSPVKERPVEERGRPLNRSPVKERHVEERGRPATKATYMSAPNRSVVAPTRSVSPSKPHPLQFVSPKVAASAPPAPPPKPARTYEAAVTGSSKLTELQQADERVDTPVLRSVQQKRSMFENKTPEPEQVDPALMSMSDRKALFEKNRSVPTPVARFGEAVTPAMLAKAKPAPVQLVTPSEAWKRKREQSPTKVNQPPAKKPSPDSYVLSAGKPRHPAEVRLKSTGRQMMESKPAEDQSQPATPNIGKKAAEIHKKLFEKPDWRENDIARQVEESKQQEMAVLLNRYKQMQSEENEAEATPGAAPLDPAHNQQKKNKESPEKYYPGINSLKKVKVSPPKPGSLYPVLAYDSDTASSRPESDNLSSRPDSVMSSDTLNSSMESIATGAPEPQLSTIPERNDSMDTEDGEETLGSVCVDEIDEMLEEAMEDSMDDGSVTFSPGRAKGSSSSSGSSHVGRSESTTSWQFHTPQPQVSRSKADDERFKTPLILSREEGEENQVQIEGVEGSVKHTVSFYRRQRPTSTNVKRIILNPNLEQTIQEVPESPRTTISQKIKILQEEVQAQMSVISQASSALNLCRSTKEFYGSAEQVEGERLLLVATHKRTAALNEISKLKAEGGLGKQSDQDTSVLGTVSLSNGISLKLKKEFVSQLKSGEADDYVHYFLCLVKCAGQVIPTQMVSTLEGFSGDTLVFPHLIKLTELPKNFQIQLEVYGLQTKREVLDHASKYHIKRQEKSMFSLTPKLMMKKESSRLVRPEKSSPGGPNSVRTSSFAMVGNTVITIDSLKRKDWRLDSVPHVSPLDGAISFKLNCHSESRVEFRGFLTMFDDVSGYGAWHRRWFKLEGNRLSYWKYPEHQKTEEPIGSIDLGSCITDNVSVAPRDICSRMNTFLLETRRPARTSDRESLVLLREGSTTIIRHLLSADSREERLNWCDVLNKALDNLRAWDPGFKEHRSNTLSSVSSSDSGSVSTEIW